MEGGLRKDQPGISKFCVAVKSSKRIWDRLLEVTDKLRSLKDHTATHTAQLGLVPNSQERAGTKVFVVVCSIRERREKVPTGSGAGAAPRLADITTSVYEISKGQGEGALVSQTICGYILKVTDNNVQVTRCLNTISRLMFATNKTKKFADLSIRFTFDHHLPQGHAPFH